MLTSYAGMNIVLDENMVVQVGEDWSGVRSPARARRRRKRGFPQRVKPIYQADSSVYSIKATRTLVMHPQTAARLEAEIDKRNKERAHDLNFQAF